MSNVNLFGEPPSETVGHMPEMVELILTHAYHDVLWEFKQLRHWRAPAFGDEGKDTMRPYTMDTAPGCSQIGHYLDEASTTHKAMSRSFVRLLLVCRSWHTLGQKIFWRHLFWDDDMLVPFTGASDIVSDVRARIHSTMRHTPPSSLEWEYNFTPAKYFQGRTIPRYRHPKSVVGGTLDAQAAARYALRVRQLRLLLLRSKAGKRPVGGIVDGEQEAKTVVVQSASSLLWRPAQYQGLTTLVLSGVIWTTPLFDMVFPNLPELRHLDICAKEGNWGVAQLPLARLFRWCPKLESLAIKLLADGTFELTDKNYLDTAQDEWNKRINGDYHFYTDFLDLRDEDVLGNEEVNKLSDGIESDDDEEARSRGSSQVEKIPLPALPAYVPLKTIHLEGVTMSKEHIFAMLQRCRSLVVLNIAMAAQSWTPEEAKALSVACPKIEHLSLAIWDSETLQTKKSSCLFSTKPDCCRFHRDNDIDEDTGIYAPRYARKSITTAITLTEIIGRYTASLRTLDASRCFVNSAVLQVLINHAPQLERLEIGKDSKINSRAMLKFLGHASRLRHFVAPHVKLQLDHLLGPTPDWDNCCCRHSGKDAFQILDWPSAATMETFIIGAHEPTYYEIGAALISLDLGHGCSRTFFGAGQRRVPKAIHHLQLNSSRSDVRYPDWYLCHIIDAISGSSPSFGNLIVSAGEIKRTRQELSRAHAQGCTFALFRQIGRMHQLRHLEIHGGQFDLHAPASDIIGGAARLQAEAAILLLPEAGYYSHSSRTGGYGEGSSGNSRDIKGKGRADPQMDHFDADDIARDGSDIQKNGTTIASHDPYLCPPQGLDDTLEAVFGYRHINTREGGSGDTFTSLDDMTNPSSPLPPAQQGAGPLRNLARLEIFRLFWSNAHGLRYQDLQWMVDHWPRLGLLLLGGVMPIGEEARIRYWFSNFCPKVKLSFAAK